MSKSKPAAKRWPLPPRTTAVLLVIAFLIVVSTALASDGAMVRKNTSRTPDLETDNAQISMAQFYVDAQKADGTVVPVEYYEVTEDADGNPIYSDPGTLVDTRDVARPLVVTYYDEIEGDHTVADLPVSLSGQLAKAVDDVFAAEALASGGVPDPDHRLDAFASVSFDDGETWKQTNLSQSAHLSSFTLKDGTVYPGTVDYGVKHAMAGNKILVVWHSKYAMGGSPRYSLKYYDDPDDNSKDVPLEYYGVSEDGVPGEPVHYVDRAEALVLDDGQPAPLDIWGVAGAQKSIDYTTWMHHGVFPFAEVGEVPFSAIWTCRGVIQRVTNPQTGLEEWGVQWRKPERLTSGRRDAMYTAIDGAENVGFGICWQEDPEGLRPGYGEGPGEGWSGSTGNHKTDIWYSFIRWEDFDGVEDPVWATTDPDWYTEDPDTREEQPIEDPSVIATLSTNRPQVYERMSMPQRITDNNGVTPAPQTGEGETADENKIIDLYAYLGRWNLDAPIPVLSVDDTGISWTKDDASTMWSAVTEDGRVLQGQTASTRTRMMMEGWVKKDATGQVIDRGAWVLLGYEETKGLGAGSGEEEPLDIGKIVKAETFAFDNPVYAGAGHIINEIDTLPTVDSDGDGTLDSGDPIYTDPIVNDFGEEQYQYAIARRPSLFTNPIVKSTVEGEDDTANVVMKGGMTSAVMLYKEGSLRQGGPADIMMRRWVLPTDWDPANVDTDNPFAFDYLHNDPDPMAGWDETLVSPESAPIAGTIYPEKWYPKGVLIDGAQNLSSTNVIDDYTVELLDAGPKASEIVPDWHADTFPEIAVELDADTLDFSDCYSCHPDSWGAEEEDGASAHGISERVLWWDQDAENVYDEYWTNGFEMAKGHRGFIDGDFIVVMFGHSPNWLMSSHGREPINLYIRRSFDGGMTWTTTPAILGGDGTSYIQIQGIGSEATAETLTYAAGEFEQMRNVSGLTASADTIIDPRYTPTNFRRQTDTLRQLPVSYDYDADTGIFDMVPLATEDARPDDVRDPSKFFAVFETGDTTVTRLYGEEAAADNLFYSRATEWGDVWDETVVLGATSDEDYYYWDWLEAKAEDKSGEASIAASPGGQFMWAVWNQCTEDDEGNVSEEDAIFRRMYWTEDEVTESMSVDIVGEPTAVEGEEVELTATATYMIGDVSQPTDGTRYVWDLDDDGQFETEGQTVTTVSTGALERVAVLAVAPTKSARAVDTGFINAALETPRVWNIKVANGNIGLAGARVKLSANFRSPGIMRSRPAPPEFDETVSAVIDWGDGTIEAGAIASKNDGQGSQRFVVGEHKYGKPGLYTVKVTVTNAYGATGWNYLQYAVIVHRKAGALAMAGTFGDPAGAGEASIAANVKYKLKGKYPTGKVLFTLNDKSFVSEKLDWMAISGRKGWVRGQGQLNGVGGYEFLLAVFDDRQNLGDLVRVKIWKANGKMIDEVVYDSQPDSPLDAVAITPMKTGKITMPLFKGKSWKYYLMQKK